MRSSRRAPPDPGSTVFSIAGLCAAHECLDDGDLLAAREVIRFEGHNRTDDVVARLVLLAVLGKVPVWLETAKANEQESGTPSQRQ